MLERVIPLVVLVAAIAGVSWFFWPRENPPPPPPSKPPVAAAPQESVQAPAHPIETVVDPGLPPLKESDPAMLQALGQVLGAAALQKFFNLEAMVPNIVATIDNLPREAYAQRLSPLKPIEGQFRVAGRDPNLVIAGDNDARYGAFVKMIEGVDTATAVAAYRRMYPLFQQAYVELGYPNGYFNDRLVEVIDHLLATPDVQGPIPVAAPHVMYEYANTELEQLSAGRKAMLRAGPANAQRLKAKLREIRAQVAGGTRP